MINHDDLALKDFDAALQLNPNHASAYSNRGRIYMETNHPLQAMNDFSRAISLSGYSEAYEYRSRLLRQQRRWTEALRDVDAAIKREPNDAYCYGNRAAIEAPFGEDI